MSVIARAADAEDRIETTTRPVPMRQASQPTR